MSARVRARLLCCLLVAAGCSETTERGVRVQRDVQVDAEGGFSVLIKNGGQEVVRVEAAKPSCSCVSLVSVPAVIAAGAQQEILGVVDAEASPPRLRLHVLTSRGAFTTRIRKRDVPEWNRELVYLDGVAPGARLDRVAGVYLDGSADSVSARLEDSQCSAVGVREHSWGPAVPVKGIPDRWFVPLDLELERELKAGPVTGVVELEGVPLRLVLLQD